jgi:hypothetical protein
MVDLCRESSQSACRMAPRQWRPQSGTAEEEEGGLGGLLRAGSVASETKAWLRCDFRLSSNHLCFASNLHCETFFATFHNTIRTPVEGLQGRYHAAMANVEKLCLEETGWRGCSSLGIGPGSGQEGRGAAGKESTNSCGGSGSGTTMNSHGRVRAKLKHNSAEEMLESSFGAAHSPWRTQDR